MDTGDHRNKIIELEVEHSEKGILPKEDGCLTEKLNEEARLAAFEGDWISCLRVCNENLQLEKKLLSRMTLFQIRSIALFELRQFENAQKDIEKFLSLKVFYPNSPSSVYVDSLQIKLMARLGNIELASLALDKSWQYYTYNSRYFDKTPTLDEITTLLRCHIDLCKIKRVPYLNYALACKIICQDMGEQLYEGLSVLDCAFHSEQSYDIFKQELDFFCKSYLRIQKLFDEIKQKQLGVDTQTIISETASCLSFLTATDNEVKSINDCQKAEVIYFARIKLLYIRKHHKLINLADHEQIYKMIEALQFGPRSMSQFFAVLWGSQKYSPGLHSSLMRSLLYRSRKYFGLNVRQSNNQVVINNVFFVE